MTPELKFVLMYIGVLGLTGLFLAGFLHYFVFKGKYIDLKEINNPSDTPWKRCQVGRHRRD